MSVIVGICKVCKGPLAQSDLITPHEDGYVHLSKVTCDWAKDHIAKSDADFLRMLKITPEEQL